MAERFFDTNVLLYLLSADTAKADRVEEALAAGATISVQVLNEFTAVALRKLGMTIAEVREALESLTSICKVVPVTMEIHQQALQVVERYRFSIYDALIVAAALDAGCTTLYTEDLQHGQVIAGTLTAGTLTAGTLTIRNPFRT